MRLVIELVIASGIVGGWIAIVCWAACIHGRRRIEECRANIDRLERELFPEWFPVDPKIEEFKRGILEHEFSMAPGAVWQVDHPGKIEWMEGEVFSTTREIDWIRDAPTIWQREIILRMQGK